jgi:hypothetical protein
MYECIQFLFRALSLFLSLWSLSAEKKIGFIRVTAIDKG